MKLDRMCVRRLKSFADYSNVAVELCASLGEGDEPNAVYSELLALVNAMIARTRYVEESEELRKRVAETETEMRELVKQLKQLLGEAETRKSELQELVAEAHELLDKTITVKQKLLAVLMKLRAR